MFFLVWYFDTAATNSLVVQRFNVGTGPAWGLAYASTRHIRCSWPPIGGFHFGKKYHWTWNILDICGYGSIPFSIPFLGEWTSINHSYFDVNYRGTIGFDALPCHAHLFCMTLDRVKRHLCWSYLSIQIRSELAEHVNRDWGGPAMSPWRLLFSYVFL